MKIWLITIGEPLPLNGVERLLRTGIFANHLHESGHDVIWWTSSFDHVRKQHVVDVTQQKVLSDKFKLILLKGCGYKKNISLARLYDHYVLGSNFAKLSKKEEKPDIILCSFPSIELSVEAVKYGLKYKTPIVLDVRDFWPDVFLDILPKSLRGAGEIVLYPLIHQARKAFKGATAITGITLPFVNWGVNKAGRSKKASDKSFPMGYCRGKITQDEKKKASIFWEKNGVNTSRFLIVFFGYFGRQFDFKTVIKAASELQETSVDFVLCGSGENFLTYKKKAENYSNVIFPGWIGLAEIAFLMEKANFGIMPYVVKDSFTKSIPNKFIEYISAGLPILSTLHGEVGSLLGQYRCGFIYKSSSDLVEQVKNIISGDYDIAQMSLASKNLFVDQFDAKKVYGEMEKYLIDVINDFRRENNDS